MRKDNITNTYYPCYLTIKIYEYQKTIATITMSNGQYITITFSAI